MSCGAGTAGMGMASNAYVGIALGMMALTTCTAAPVCVASTRASGNVASDAADASLATSNGPCGG